MSMDIDHYCEAWEADNSIIPNTIESVLYDQFFIKINAEFIYLTELAEEEEGFLDSLESTIRVMEFVVPRDQLSGATSWSTISNMLTAIGIQLHIQPFMIHKISDCADKLAKGSRSKKSLIPMIISISVVVALNEVDSGAMESMEDDDDDDDDDDVETTSESAVEGLENVRVEDRTVVRQCMVCLEVMKVGSDATQMPCSHIYHADCIVNWLRVSNFCPLCRYKLPK